MGFETNNDKSNSQNQLSLFDFKMPKTDFTPDSPKSETGSNAVDFNMWMLAHNEPEPNKTQRFMTVSAAIHAAAILLIAMMSVPLVEQAKTETITIEIEDVPPMKIARGAAVPATQGGTPALAETPVVEKIEDAGSPSSDDVIVAKPKAQAKLGRSAKAAGTKALSKAVAKNSPKGGKAATAGRSIAPKTNFQAVPMTIDDIEAPELDAGEYANTPVASNMDEDFNEDFAKLDSSQKAALAKEKKALDAMADALAAEKDASLSAIDELNQEEAARLASAQDSLKQKNASAIASALAAERAAAAAAAREAAARKAAATKRAGLGGDGNGLGTKQGAGAGNNGFTGSGTQLAGLPQGVRSLDQLRQMPGNPRPQYDRQERLRGDQGKVTFVAYISKDGFPSQFKMMASTGFRNLDAKTLAALKKWRFYPGQEGWVELPFRWDLKGGAQEDGGLLRRVSSRQ